MARIQPCVKYITPVIAINQCKGPELLEKFRSAVGGRGYIGGPHPSPAGRSPYWTYHVGAFHQCEAVFNVLAPYLGSVKIAQFERALHRIQSRQQLRFEVVA